MSGGGLTLDRLTVSQGGERLVALDCTVEPGAVLTIMGPSGSGKSTLLAALVGTLAPPFQMTGRVLLAGRDVTPLPPNRRRIGILFQDDMLFAHLSVGGNLGFALPPGLGRAARQQRIEQALADAGLAGFAARDPATLSGGRRARVALLRMLLADPLALLLDEPFSRLDTGLRSQIRAFVLARARAQGLPELLVTHEAGDGRAAAGPVLSPLGDPLVLPDQADV